MFLLLPVLQVGLLQPLCNEYPRQSSSSNGQNGGSDGDADAGDEGDEGDGGRYGMLVETGVVMVVTMMIKQRR